MGRDWNAFIKAVDKAPKEFAKAVVDHLDAPIYAKQALRKLEYLCGWPGCWTCRIDVCFKCDMSVCEEHCEIFLGPKTKLEWYVCNGCLANTPHEELLKEIAEQDEEFWLEDQEEAIDIQGEKVNCPPLRGGLPDSSTRLDSHSPQAEPRAGKAGVRRSRSPEAYIRAVPSLQRDDREGEYIN